MTEAAPPVDLTPDHWVILCDVLRRHIPDRKVLAFGSRATWTAKDYSDLDLAILGDDPVPLDTISALAESFGESDLPFKVDLVDWARVDSDFRQIISQEGVTVSTCDGHCITQAANQQPSSIRSISNLGWSRMTLGDCIEINNATYRLSEAWSFVNYLDTGNIIENHISEIQHFTIGQDKLPSRARRKARSGDIVYSTVRPNQRHFGVLKDIPENFLASTGFSVLRAKNGIAHTDFVYYFLTQDCIIDQLQTIAEHSTSAYPSIKSSDIGSLGLYLPPLAEQRAIAHILGSLDDKIELNRRMNETLEAMMQAIFKDWFVDFGPVRAKKERRNPYLPAKIWDLFPDTLDDEGKPCGWGISEIGKEVEVLGGSTPSTKEPAYWEKGEHHWATPKDLSKLSSPVLLATERKVTDKGVEKISSGLLPVGTVLLSSRAPIGYLAIAQTKTAINQGFIAMVCEKKLPNVFVLFWCYENLDFIKAISGGSTFSEINKSVFRTIPVIIPPRAILAVFESIVSPWYDLVVMNEKESKLLSRSRDLLLPSLISGEIRVSDAEQVVGVVL